MPSVPYVTVDVFTAERFGGNPLAVIPDARQVREELMQKIAAEFNYSETVFVLPPEDGRNTAQVRIFTPTNEVPFAGHPNVGTAFVLGRAGEACGRGLSGNPVSSIGYERRNNRALRHDDVEAFVRDVLRDVPPPPAHQAEIVAANRAGRTQTPA